MHDMEQKLFSKGMCQWHIHYTWIIMDTAHHLMKF
jgi:hypothetical protein